MRPFDSVDVRVIYSLDPMEAITLLHDLIRAELRRLAIPIDMLSVPYEINIADGGIDAVVSVKEGLVDSHLIFGGRTYYQSKAGDITFSKAGMQGVVCSDKGQKPLKPKIKEIAEANGNLVLYFTGKSAPNIEDLKKWTLELIHEEVPDSKIKIYIVQAENIVGMLDDYISLRHKYSRINGFPGKSFESWSNQPIMNNHFESDEKRDEKINNLKSLIRSTDESDRIIRVCGFPGVGKTRSVLEALREDDLIPLVIYFENPSLVLDSNLITELANKPGNEVIIVVDECDSIGHTQFVNAAGSVKSNLKIVTIYNEPLNSVASKTVDFNDNELSEETIVAIIESYHLPNDIAKRWEPYCEGSPRVAHMIAENLTRDTGDIFANPSYDNAMERILANTEDLRSDVYRKRKDVISWLSLFHRFGWGQEFEEERKFLLNKVMVKTGYSENDIQTVIQELKQRKVLQGDVTLYISPRLLHIRAWVWWWERYGEGFDLDEIKHVNNGALQIEMPSQLYEWFTQMFEYAREVEGASDVVKHLLSADGPLSKEPELMEALGGNFFLSLTKADPESALESLERWLGTLSDEQLRNIPVDRMNLVRSLEYICVWKELFSRGASLLLRVAATESNHTYSNNSEGTFAELFSNGPGKVAPTEATPEIRLPILRRAIESPELSYQLLAIKSVDSGLEVAHWTRIAGPEIQGLREEPKLWSPKTYGEIYSAVRNIWKLLLENLNHLQPDARKNAAEVINNNLRSLISHTLDADDYLNEYFDLLKKKIIHPEDALKAINILKRFDFKKLPASTKSIIEKIEIYLEGNDLPSRLKRYIAYNSTDDWWGDEENVNRSTNKVAELVKELVDDPQNIIDNDWLFSKEAKNAHKLGIGISEISESEKMFELILNLQKLADLKYLADSSSILLSGYLSSVYKINPKKWQSYMEIIAKDEALVRWYAEICWRSHLGDENASVILDFVKQGKLDPKEFRLFRFGAVVKDLSENIFNKWIDYLLKQKEVENTMVAIDLFASYYIFQEDRLLPEALTERLITSPTLLEKNQKIASDIDYDWSTVAERYINQYPKKSEKLLELLLKNFGEDNTIFGTYGSYVKSILNKIIKLNPENAWEKISGYLDDSLHSYRLELNWLGASANFDGESGGALDLFPMELIFKWIDEKPKLRARKIAALVPHDYNHDKGELSWYAEILDRYGDDEKVQNAINANFGSEGFSGPSSLHYAKKVETLKRFASFHPDSLNIQNWASRNISYLNARVRDAKLKEERRDF